MALFSKALNRVDIEQGMVFDHQNIAALPPLRRGDLKNLSVTDGRAVWNFHYSLNAAGKAKFTGGWIDFARNLSPGNMVFFHENEDDGSGAQYKITVRA